MVMHKTRLQAEPYGQALGILLLDSAVPSIPGDVGNASTYEYPVICAIPGLTTDICLSGAPEFTPRIIEAARWLESQGARAISSDCGFMLQYEEAVRAAVRIPVCLFSLLQLPMIARRVLRSRSIGVVSTDSTRLTPDFLTRAGIFVANQFVIRGMQDQPRARRGRGGRRRQAHGRRKARDGAFLVECSMLPPYSRSIQEATGLPVFDFITMIDYHHKAMNRHTYSGHY